MPIEDALLLSVDRFAALIFRQQQGVHRISQPRESEWRGHDFVVAPGEERGIERKIGRRGNDDNGERFESCRVLAFSKGFEERFFVAGVRQI